MSDTKPRFYVINRGSGSEGSDEDAYKPPIVKTRPRHLPNPPKPLPTPTPPISTNIKGPRYQPSYQSLSSPSPTTTSSPGANEESTPPPSTPGPPPELDIEQVPEVYHQSRPETRVPRSLPAISPKRPEISPTDHGDRTLILVTADSERYVNVDITGAKTAAAIRECVFSKLNIFDDAKFVIYQTEIGTSAISGALSDERLLELCRRHGDAKGSLKLLIMNTAVSVPERSDSLRINTAHPTTNGGYTPLRPRKTSRSRHGSLSSGTSEQTPEVAAGYEADLDNPERDSRRTTIRPLPPNGTSPSSPWPNGLSSPLPHNSRSNSPPSTMVDKYGNVVLIPPPPPPLSPDRANFTESTLTPPADRSTHHKSESETAEELGSLRNQPSGSRSKQDHAKRQRTKRPEMDEKSESWVVVSREGPRSGDYDAPQESPRKSPASAKSARHQLSPRYHRQATSPYTGRPLHIPTAPRNPPPAVPTTSAGDLRTQQSRPPGQQVPYNWTVTWKGEEKGDAKPSPPTSNWPPRLAKGATRSMDNLRNPTYSKNYPPSSRRAPPPPLPMSQSSSTLIPYGRDPSSSSLAKSYESRIHVRPLPVQGTHSPSTLEVPNPYSSRYPGHVPPSTDPHPRPTSALGDSVSSPTQRFTRQPAQSPTYMTMLDPMDHARSPQASPNQQLHPLPSRSGQSERRVEAKLKGLGSPPRSPVSPRTHIGDRSKSDATLTREDHGWLLQVMDNPEATVVPDSESRRPNPPVFDDSDSDHEGGTSLWAKPPIERPKSGQRGPALTVQIEGPNGVHSVAVPSCGSSSMSNSTVTPTPARRAHSPSGSGSGTVTPLNVKQRPRGSTFTEPTSSWAPRPPPEDVYERLEEFFPEHDLDKPLIEATSGGTSPTAIEHPILPAPPNPPEKSRVKGKKSIRHVAEEHKKRIDRTSRCDTASFASTVMRKRSTKLWGIKLEEVTTMQPRMNHTASVPESPAGGPTTFKWVRGELIGRGTYGRVYLALNATTGEMIAVKQVEIPRTASDQNDSRHTTVVQALKLESETLKDLDHPNIVQYLGFEETPSNLSIFLEYVPGGSVGGCLLKHGKFDEEVTKSFTAQILDGLEYLHSKGILHRDLKADNILVEVSGICKISDFGISKRTEDSGAATAMQGTVFWMAPEVVNPQGKAYNFKVDIWSVGCVVLEMWAGMRPWQGDELVAVMFKLYQMKLPPPVPEDVVLSELGDDFRKKCFAINPDERPTAAELRKHKYLELTPGWVFTGFK